MDTPQENPKDPVWLTLRIPGLQVKHFTTEPYRITASCLDSNEIDHYQKILKQCKRVQIVYTDMVNLLADAPTSLFTKHGSLLLSDSPIVWTSLLF